MFLKQLYFIFFSTSIFAQLTNIENLPIRKINEYNLKRNILRNGEEIQLLNTEESIYDCKFGIHIQLLRLA